MINKRLWLSVVIGLVVGAILAVVGADAVLGIAAMLFGGFVAWALLKEKKPPTKPDVEPHKFNR